MKQAVLLHTFYLSFDLVTAHWYVDTRGISEMVKM